MTDFRGSIAKLINDIYIYTNQIARAAKAV